MSARAHTWRSRASAPRGVTLIEVALAAMAIIVCAAALLPAAMRLRSLGGDAVSMANLQTISLAHALYGWDWNDRQVTWIPDDAGVDANPVTLFFDGHVAHLPTAQAVADDEVVFEGTGGAVGLWTRDTPLGVDGYFGALGYDGTRVSHHVLTADGILGRDVLGPAAGGVAAPARPSHANGVGVLDRSAGSVKSRDRAPSARVPVLPADGVPLE